MMKVAVDVVVVAAALLLVTELGNWSSGGNMIRTTNAAISEEYCKYVLDHAKACKNYVTGKEDAVAVNSDCCHGLRKLVRKTAGDVEQQKDVCGCSAKIFERLKDVQEDRLATLPSACKAKFTFTLSKTPDCDNIGK